MFEQEGDGKHLLSVGKYGAWNITKPEQVHAEKWMVSPRMFGSMRNLYLRIDY